MLNHIETVDPEFYRILTSIIETGKIEKDSKLLDLSPVQTIKIMNGKVTFDPPMKVSAKLAGIRINTTISEVRKTGSGIKVDINNSPIDLEIRPQ